MSPYRRRRSSRRAISWVALGAATVLAAAAETQALRIATYNVTNYPGSTSATRNPNFRTVIGPMGADVLVVQEMISAAGVTEFLGSVLNTLEPNTWSAAPFTNGNDTDNALFYKHGKVDLVGSSSFYPNPANQLRLVNVYHLRPKDYTSTGAEFRIYSQHLKASTGSSNEAQRFEEAKGIRSHMNAMPAGTHAILLGDFNIYTSSESAFVELLESQPTNIGRVYDPQNVTGNWDNSPGYAIYHTQCPCLNNCPTGFGFAGGGMDSRFDMILPTYNMNDGQGFEVLVSSYKVIAQDGQHYNKDINVAPVIAEGQAYADALVMCSDHLPVRIDLQIPARISVAPSLAFGTVIVGAAAAQNLGVSNPAVPPADALDYSFAAPAGFGAPGSFFVLAAGAAPASHTITMSTSSPGVKAGNLTITTDAPDDPSELVALSGTVLAHAVASLDSLSTTLAATLDLGDHEPGQFTDGSVRVHNRGYSSLQARLSLTSGVITGGGGRFSLAGGFTPVLVGATSQGYLVHFDDAGATPDSVYNATLTFASSDEALPGATPQPNLVVTLRAQVLGATDAGDVSRIAATRLYAPFPNPPSFDGTTLRFDLVSAADLRLDVFDVAGRRVTGVARGSFARGRHDVRWSARDAEGRLLAAGVYFVRMTGAGFPTQVVRVTIVR